ncbi:hypothetical protein, partial [Mycobacterium sp.]|uniref:hypothetical protein n=1 Tax=Mycobacterium sp. TaxID=1785 RepID=UPI003F997ABA
MRAGSTSRLVQTTFGLVLILSAAAAVWLLISYAVVRIAQHNKGLRPTLLKPYNRIIRPIAGRP